MFEFVDEIIRYCPDLVDDLDRRLERYAALDLELLGALGGNKFAASPTRIVARSR